MRLKFAIPTQNGNLCPHFGHCEKFAIIETEEGKISNQIYIDPPMHQPGVYPKFLAEQGVHVIIAGGMGQRAKDLFDQHNIEVCVGVASNDPSMIVQDYLKKRLQTGENLCDH